MAAVSTVALVDLEAACELYGRDTVPDPLGRSRPVGSVWLLSRDHGPIENRLNGGDMGDVRTWIQALGRAEVCLECRVSSAEGPDFRLHALKVDETGFLATQRIDPDGVEVVDISVVPSQALAAVVVQTVGLVGAGSRLRIAVVGGGDRLPVPPETVDEYDDFGFLIPKAEPRDTALEVVDACDVIAVAELKSWHDPDRRWDGDANRQILQWVQIKDDGDYLYVPGGAGYAEPLDTALLRTCLDELIAG